jgi:hypothetical protein
LQSRSRLRRLWPNGRERTDHRLAQGLPEETEIKVVVEPISCADLAAPARRQCGVCPSQGNRSRNVEAPALREAIGKVVRRLVRG